MTAARRKGAQGEQEFARLLSAALDMDISRNLDQARDGGADIMFDLDGATVAVEVKRRKEMPTEGERAAWLRQVERVPADIRIVAYRPDRRPWRVMVPGIRVEDDAEITVDTSIDALLTLLFRRPPA